MEVMDAHQHVGSLVNVIGGAPEGSGGAPISLEEEQKNRVRRLKQSGIDRAVIQPAHGYLKPDGIKDTMRVNDAIAGSTES